VPIGEPLVAAAIGPHCQTPRLGWPHGGQQCGL